MAQIYQEICIILCRSLLGDVYKRIGEIKTFIFFTSTWYGFLFFTPEWCIW